MGLKLLYPHRQSLGKETKTLLCDSLVLSHFNYCSQIYEPAISKDTSKKIQRVQNSCMRLIFGIRKFDKISYKLQELNWLNMKNRRYLQCAVYYYNIIKKQSPIYLFNKMSFRTDVHHLNLRNKGLLTPPIHHSAFFQKSFSYHITKIYNNLLNSLKNCSTRFFRKNLITILKQQQNLELQY